MIIRRVNIPTSTSCFDQDGLFGCSSRIEAANVDGACELLLFIDGKEVHARDIDVGTLRKIGEMIISVADYRPPPPPTIQEKYWSALARAYERRLEVGK